MCKSTSILKTVLKKDEWIKGKYYVSVSKYVNTIVCDSRKQKALKWFKKITHFCNRLNEIIVYIPKRPPIDIPIKYF